MPFRLVSWRASQLTLCRSNFTGAQPNTHQFDEFYIKTPRCNLVIAKLTKNTFALAVLPPGESELNCCRINLATAREDFMKFDGLANKGEQAEKSLAMRNRLQNQQEQEQGQGQGAQETE